VALCSINTQSLTRSGDCLQVDDNVGVHVALDTRIAVADHVVPDAAVATLRDQLLPSRAAKGVLALFGAQLDHGVEEGEVEAPHLDPGAARRRRDGRVAHDVGRVDWRRGDDGLDSRQRLGESSRQEQLGSLSVGFGDLRRLLP